MPYSNYPITTGSNPQETEARERMLRRASLKPGEEFYAHDLFDEFGMIPLKLLASELLTAQEKLCWTAIARRLGREGQAIPSYATLGRDLGVDRHQAMRLVRGLEAKRFIRVIARSAENPNQSTSHEYRLLWHPVFSEGERASSENSPLRPGDNSPTPEKQSSEKNQLEEVACLTPTIQ